MIVSIDHLLNCKSVKWMESAKGQGDIIISSRIRLARNLRDIPFPQRLNQATGEECLQKIKDACQEEMPAALHKMEFTGFDQLSVLDRRILVEKHLISPGHAQSNSAFRAIILNEDGSLATMV